MIPSSLRAFALVLSASAWVGAVAAEPALPPRALVKIGTDHLRARDSIVELAFSPDGRTVAAAVSDSETPKFSLFDVKTGRRMKSIRPAARIRGRAAHLAFSPDGGKILWGESGGHVGTWDLAADRLLFRERLHRQSVNDVAFSPDGNLMVSAGEDGLVRFRRVANPAESFRDLKMEPSKPAGPGISPPPAAGSVLVPAVPGGGPEPARGGPEPARCLAFTPDGSRVIVGSGDVGMLSIWNIQDGRMLGRIVTGTAGDPRGSTAPIVSAAAALPDDRRVLSVAQRTVTRPEPRPKHMPRTAPTTDVCLWDIETGKRIRALSSGEEPRDMHAALSRSGRRVVLADSQALRILDVETGRIEQTATISGYLTGAPVFSPDDSLVALPIDKVVALFDSHTGRRIRHDETRPEGFIASASWSPSGDRIATVHNDGVIRVWETETGKLLWHRALAPPPGPGMRRGMPNSVNFSDDGHRVVVTGFRDDHIENRRGIVAIYEATRGLVVRESSFDPELLRSALSPDRRVVVAVGSPKNHGNDFHVYATDVETGLILFTTPSEHERIGFQEPVALRFRPDSASFLMATNDGNVIRLDARTGREESRFLADWRMHEPMKARRPRSPDLWAGSFSADGRTLASSSSDSVYLWDVAAGKLRHAIHRAGQGICYVALCPDGQTLATSEVPLSGQSSGDTIRLYDTGTGVQVLALEPDDDRAVSLAFSPDGSKLFTGLQSGSAMIWDVRRVP